MGAEAGHYERKSIHESIRLLIEGESIRRGQFEQTNVTICMVPDTLRNLNPTAYTPLIVSIGPLHKENPHLRAIEVQKVTHMYRLFLRTKETTGKAIEQISYDCAQPVLGLLTRARACYAPSLTNYEDFKLAEMMVIDGCFILELLYTFKYGIGEGDPIFDNILDMNIINNSQLTTIDGTDTVEPCHILGLLQHCYRPVATMRGRFPNISYSATEIVRAGVTFKEQTEEYSPLAVKFIQPSLVPGLGTLFVRETCLKIPVLCIQDTTASFLRNLIAYEQCYPFSRHYVTSFAFLMDRLIDTKDDVSLLVKAKVLQHKLEAIEDVTNLFNNICKGVVLREFYYTEEWRQLDKYCKRFRPSILI
ncbi:unnamed protein product [Lactuca virosa]|uniref:Uncharacterized protein n=1 Tax=Lactuca virosa TaxID=75947 RepID=A0AAU9N5J3_9ASTR|nr:unnamed protein product [Lactuca virosa]